MDVGAVAALERPAAAVSPLEAFAMRLIWAAMVWGLVATVAGGFALDALFLAAAGTYAVLGMVGLVLVGVAWSRRHLLRDRDVQVPAACLVSSYLILTGAFVVFRLAEGSLAA
jgi:hypothetical protein